MRNVDGTAIGALSAAKQISLGALKAGEQIVPTILAASTACKGNRPGTSSGKSIMARVFEPMDSKQ